MSLSSGPHSWNTTQVPLRKFLPMIKRSLVWLTCISDKLMRLISGWPTGWAKRKNIKQNSKIRNEWKQGLKNVIISFGISHIVKTTKRTFPKSGKITHKLEIRMAAAFLQDCLLFMSTLSIEFLAMNKYVRFYFLKNGK